MTQVVDVIDAGAIKHGEGSWKEVYEGPKGKQALFDKTMRHLTDWKKGHKIDSDSGQTNLSRVVANVLILLELETEDQDEQNKQT